MGAFKYLETKVVRAGSPSPRIKGAVVTPIFQSANFEYAGETSYHDLKYIRLNNTPTQTALHAKLAHYFPEGIDQRYQGPWRDYVFPATPDRAIAHFRALIEAGIQYIIVETMDAMDHDTIRLLATDVIPAIRVIGSQRG